MPTPTFSTFKKKEEPPKETVKYKPKIEKVEIKEKFINEKFDIVTENVPVVEQFLDLVTTPIKEVEKLVESESKVELDVYLKRDLESSPKSDISAGSSKTELETPFEKHESDKKSDSEIVKIGSEERRSSESEPDSDAVPLPSVADDNADDDHERKGLFLQESLDDELPYVPTTLPQERYENNKHVTIDCYNITARAIDSSLLLS